jgi:hypothetical protein
LYPIILRSVFLLLLLLLLMLLLLLLLMFWLLMIKLASIEKLIGWLQKLQEAEIGRISENP